MTFRFQLFLQRVLELFGERPTQRQQRQRIFRLCSPLHTISTPERPDYNRLTRRAPHLSLDFCEQGKCRPNSKYQSVQYAERPLPGGSTQSVYPISTTSTTSTTSLTQTPSFYLFTPRRPHTHTHTRTAITSSSCCLSATPAWESPAFC
jgi:hypothetical protein